MQPEDVVLFATDLPAGELLEAAWAEASREEAQQLVDEMSPFLPQLAGMPLEQAWKTLFLVLVFVYLVLPFG